MKKQLKTTLLNKFLEKRTENVFIQLFRYSVSGGVAFVVDALLLYVLTEKVGLYYLYSNIISFTIGLIITYLFSIWWIFDNRRFSDKKIEFPIFVILGIAGLLLTSLFMWVFTEKLGVYYMISKFITTVIVSFISFFIKKVVLFPKNKDKI